MLNKRNTNIEILRLLSMLAIIFHHFMLHNATPLEAIDNKFFFYFAKIFLLPIGKPAVLIFILITIWFSLEKQPDLKNAIKKIIKLNSIMVFYSVLIGILFLGQIQPDELPQHLVNMAFPLLTSLWWFPVTYSLLILFTPYFYEALIRQSNRELAFLAVISILLSGVFQYVPYFAIEAIKGNGLLELLGTFPLICLIKKNYSDISKKISFKTLAALNILGFLLIGIELFGCQNITNKVLNSLFVNLYNSSVYDPASISSMLIAFSTFIFTLKIKKQENVSLNQIAASSFSIYLITDHPNIRNLLWSNLFNLQALTKNSTPLLIQVLIISIAIAVTALIIDILIRRVIWNNAKYIFKSN